MQSLDGKKRDIFEVVGEKGLFSVEKQSIKLSERDLSGTGQIPVFSSQTSNNGVMGFTNKVADFFIKDTPALIFGDHTKSMDISNHSFCAADNVKVLRPQNIPFDALFYVSCAWKKRIPDMGYARHWRKAKKVGIELPVTDSGKPDYAYMAEYVQQKRAMMLAKYRAYVEERIAELGEVAEIPALDEKEWCEFSLDDIFTVSAGKRLETRNKVPGTRPFIGATDNNNGVTGFVGNDNSSRDGNVLGVNYNGAPCIAFYHPYECIFTDDVKRLHLRHHSDNKFVLLFFVSIFAKQRSKYSYGYKFKEQRMLRQKLMLPITDSGEPDYEYMEQYSKNIMLRKYQQYLMFLQQRSGAR
ncbi:restriction endonuclease subunit S [Agathobaculum sp. Marseille-P7918]|uniref:restriction endonuclease subunit S n=1 Tax=Agathobaculum sp. Marseille-P7918 TaxID=2479843 RepID=UPI0019D2D1CA|nr:restriction endonuclease subunit S [Agathobaculum sp. Marseille-P7918]